MEVRGGKRKEDELRWKKRRMEGREGFKTVEKVEGEMFNTLKVLGGSEAGENPIFLGCDTFYFLFLEFVDASTGLDHSKKDHHCLGKTAYPRTTLSSEPAGPHD